MSTAGCPSTMHLGQAHPVVNELQGHPGHRRRRRVSRHLRTCTSTSSTTPRPIPATFGDFNRYVELIHDPKYLRVGEYAFSIDDAAGNMLEVGDGVNITVGGAHGLGNTTPTTRGASSCSTWARPPENGLTWAKYRICTADDLTHCPNQAPDRVMKEADRPTGQIGYAGIKIGAVKCPCVIVLQDSAGTRYKVSVDRLPAPPPAHPLDKEGIRPPPTMKGGRRRRATPSTSCPASTRRRPSTGAGTSRRSGSSTSWFSGPSITSIRRRPSSPSRASASSRATSWRPSPRTMPP